MPLITDLAKKTILPVVQIQKTSNGAQFFTFNHFTGTYDFRLISYNVKPPFDSVGGRFTIEITDSVANMTAFDALYADIEIGNEVIFWVGKDDATKKKVMRGIIEDLVLDESHSANRYVVQMGGPDFGSAILKNRLVNGEWEQDKAADGITLLDDPDVLISQIVKDLLTDKEKYSASDFSAIDQGIIYNAANVLPPAKYLSNFDAIHQPLDDVLSQLDSQSDGAVHWVDADKNFHMKKPTFIDSGILLVDTKTDPLLTGAGAWNPAKVGMLLKRSLKVEKTGKYRYQRLFGLGGDKRELDPNKQESIAGGSDSLETHYRAHGFIPTFRQIVAIGIHVSRTATLPSVPLFVELHEDTEITGTRPNGSLIRTLKIDAAKISIAGDWNYVTINAEVNRGNIHWIVLRRENNANSYSWSKTTSGSGLLTASSTDGATWTEVTGSTGYTFRIYYSTPLLSIFSLPTGVSASTKLFKEKMYRDPAITTDQDLVNKLNVAGQTEFYRKQTIDGYMMHPDIILENGMKVRVSQTGVRKPQSGDFIVGGLEYIGNASAATRTGTLYQKVTLTRFIS